MPHKHNPGMTRTEDAPVLTRFKEAARLSGYAATQQGVAQMLGISQPSVAEWNRGGMPTIDRARSAAEKSGLCVEWLYTERGPKFPSPADSEDPLLRELVGIWEKLTAESKAQLIGTAKLMRTTQTTACPERIKEVHRDLAEANHRFRTQKRPTRR